MDNYEKNMTKLIEFYSQRAKKHWARDGDRNTTFFHQAVLKRRRWNTILSIKDENNVTHFKPESIAQTFVNYFRHIFSSQNTNNGKPYLGTQPLQMDQDYIIPNKQEIWRTL